MAVREQAGVEALEGPLQEGSGQGPVHCLLAGEAGVPLGPRRKRRSRRVKEWLCLESGCWTSVCWSFMKITCGALLRFLSKEKTQKGHFDIQLNAFQSSDSGVY